MTQLRICAGCGEIVELDIDENPDETFPYFCEICAAELEGEPQSETVLLAYIEDEYSGHEHEWVETNWDGCYCRICGAAC